MGHTPGPWNNSGGYITDATGTEIADVEWAGSEPEGKANARLIAAAPELLAACREAVSAITYLLSNDDDDPNYADTLNTLAAAISKAEGRAE